MTLSGESRSEVVELRVHGVHGTSPASMLGVDQGDVRQVAGDNLTGSYRSKSGELPYRALTNRPVGVEAYSWGTLTSGVPRFLGWVQRALWLLLLPFALANLSYWARLGVGAPTREARAGARFTRLGALLLTVFMVLIPAIIGIDLVAWQCYRGDSPGCTPLPGLLDFMADLTPAQRLAVGSLLPLAFVAVLWLLSRQSLLRYEEVTYKGRESHDPTSVLRHPGLWNGKLRTQQLQRVHLTVALATVVAFSAGHVVNHKVGGGGPVWATFVAALVLAVVAAFWALTVHPDDVEHVEELGRLSGRTPTEEGYRGWHRWLPGALVGAMGVVTLVHLVVLWGYGATLHQKVDFVGDNTWFISVFVALTAAHLALFTGERMGRWWSRLVVLLVLLLAAIALLRHLRRLDDLPGSERAWEIGGVVGAAVLLAVLGIWQFLARNDHGDQAWNGAGASVMLATAAWVALLFTTGAVTATANYLNGSGHGVDDLVSRLGDSPTSSATQVVTKAAEGSVLAVTGDVVVRDAVITLDGADPVIRSGTVESERLFDVEEKAVRGLDGVALQKGRTRLRDGYVVLDTDHIRIQDSCVRQTDDSPCSPESSRFLVGGMLDLSATSAPGRPLRIRIDGRGHGVELRPTSPPAVPLVVPQVLVWAPLAQTAWLVGCGVWVLLALLLFRRSRPEIDALVETEIDRRDRAACIKARRRAAFAHRAERLLDGIGAITSFLAIGLIVVSARGRAPWDWQASLRPFATLGMYVALALGLGLVLLFSRVRTSEGTRKAVGVLWDLTTFWPRAAHPLAPPCYAERVVPELRTRVDWALHHRTAGGPDVRAGNRVVLSGHSQGSVIVCALVSRLPEEDLGRIRVITYGSQVRALYGRIFPAVFGPEQIGYEPTGQITTLSHPEPDAPARPVPHSAAPWAGRPGSLTERIHGAGGSWVNLFRRTDPLGFRVFSDHEQPRPAIVPGVVVGADWYVPEVPDVVVGDAGPQVNTHGGYQHTLVYRTAVAAWTGEVLQPDPVGTTDIPPLPV
jgi:hypothetical protein